MTLAFSNQLSVGLIINTFKLRFALGSHEGTKLYPGWKAGILSIFVARSASVSNSLTTCSEVFAILSTHTHTTHTHAHSHTRTHTHTHKRTHSSVAAQVLHHVKYNPTQSYSELIKLINKHYCHQLG